MLKVYIKLMLTTIFWGGTFISGRVLATQVSPFIIAFLRFAVAAVVLLGVLYRRHNRFPTVPKNMLLLIVCLSLTGVFINNVFFFWGLQTVPAGRASVIVANNPIFIAVFTAFIFRERLGWVKWLGVFISVTGAIIAISRGDIAGLFRGDFGTGDLMILLCVMCWVAFSLIGKTVVARIPPLTAISYAAAIGALMLLVPALMDGMLGAVGNFGFLDWGNIAYIGIFGTAFGFVWYYEGIENIGATRASLFINFVPISAIIMAFFLLGEPITISLLIGTAFVLSGVYLTNNGLSRFN